MYTHEPVLSYVPLNCHFIAINEVIKCAPYLVSCMLNLEICKTALPPG